MQVQGLLGPALVQSQRVQGLVSEGWALGNEWREGGRLGGRAGTGAGGGGVITGGGAAGGGVVTGGGTAGGGIVTGGGGVVAGGGGIVTGGGAGGGGPGHMSVVRCCSKAAPTVDVLGHVSWEGRPARHLASSSAFSKPSKVSASERAELTFDERSWAPEGAVRLARSSRVATPMCVCSGVSVLALTMCCTGTKDSISAILFTAQLKEDLAVPAPTVLRMASAVSFLASKASRWQKPGVSPTPGL